METNHLSQHLALTHALDTTRYAMFRLAYAVRAKMMRWCLTFANFLERGQAHAITRAASAKGLGLPAGITVPPPSFPSPERAHFSLPRAPPRLFPDEPPLNGIAQGKAALMHLRLSDSELRYEDFDDAPTAVYHAVPTLDGRPRGAHQRPPVTRREITQGEVRVTSK